MGFACRVVVAVLPTHLLLKGRVLELQEYAAAGMNFDEKWKRKIEMSGRGIIIETNIRTLALYLLEGSRLASRITLGLRHVRVVSRPRPL